MTNQCIVLYCPFFLHPLEMPNLESSAIKYNEEIAKPYFMFLEENEHMDGQSHILYCDDL